MRQIRRANNKKYVAVTLNENNKSTDKEEFKTIDQAQNYRKKEYSSGVGKNKRIVIFNKKTGNLLYSKR